MCILVINVENTSIYGAKKTLATWRNNVIRKLAGVSVKYLASFTALLQGTLILPDTWFRLTLWDLLVLQLLRPDSSNLPCLYSTFHLEYPLVFSRFCLSIKICVTECIRVYISKKRISYLIALQWYTYININCSERSPNLYPNRKKKLSEELDEYRAQSDARCSLIGSKVLP